MKITENINIGGLIFTIDEDALVKLQNYLSSIEKYFGEKEEQEEIVSDIEARIAELFQNQLSKSKEVITITDVNKVIEILGLPEDFESINTQKHKSSSYSSSSSSYRKLYRDTNQSVLGGVCSGLGHYFNTDLSVIRIVFVLLAFFAAGGFIIYIILWIAIPPAISLEQKMEMKGQGTNPIIK